MRYYSSTATPTTIVGDIASTTTSFTVAALNGYPGNYPFTAALDPDTDNEELVDVTDISGNVVTVTRGVAGTTAIGHSAGAVFEHRTSHRDYQEPQDHLGATVGVHGVTGNLVGDSDVQTLTNKTIDATQNTISGLTTSDIQGLSAELSTLTNVTIESGTIVDYSQAVENGSQSTSVTYDATVKNVFDTTLTGNVTVTLNAGASGSAWELTLIHRQDGTGGRVVTWPASVKWPNGTAPNPDTSASAINIFSLFTVDGGTTWFGFLSGRGMK